MIKYKKTDALAILRLFGIADENDGAHSIDQFRFYDVDDQSTLLSFRFSKMIYFLLTDHRADDDSGYVTAQIRQFTPNHTGNLISNPQDSAAYALPYKGKEVYLYRQSPLTTRLDKELSSRYPDLSRATIQKYIKGGHVTLNDVVLTKPNTLVQHTDSIALSLPQRPDHSAETLPIIYIDDDVVVIDKPEGVLTHSKGALNDEFTVAAFLSRYSTYNASTNRPGIVHRLDRDTSGILIGARDGESGEQLKKQFADRKVTKIYFAVVAGRPKHEKAVIDVPIGRNPNKPSTYQADPNGKPAQTSYEVLVSDGNHSLVKLTPKSGRTHQLRVHMAYLGTPIVGDRLYSDSAADRLYLHAAELTLRIPGAKEEKTFRSPIPESFKEMVKK